MTRHAVGVRTWRLAVRTLSIAAVLLVVVLGSLTAARRTVYAQEPGAAPQGTTDPWQFADDDTTEHVPTWQEAARAQAVDLALFSAFAGLALVSFFRKSVPLKYVTMAASVAYLGI